MAPAADRGRAVLLFNTTNAALEAETEIIAAGFWCEVVPRPPGAPADGPCGLAVAVAAADAQEVISLLAKAGIDAVIHRERDGDHAA